MEGSSATSLPAHETRAPRALSLMHRTADRVLPRLRLTRYHQGPDPRFRAAVERLLEGARGDPRQLFRTAGLLALPLAPSAAATAFHLPSPVTMPGDEANNVLYGHWFPAATRPPLAATVFLHGWRRDALRYEFLFCQGLAAQGIDCLLLVLPYHGPRRPAGTWSGELALSPDIYRTVWGFRQAVIEARLAAHWLRAYRTQRVGIVGFSLGGMIAHVVMATEAFDFGVSIGAAGALAELVFTSPATRGVRAAMVRHGIDRATLRQTWQCIDPLTFGPLNRTRRLLMMSGKYDAIVPEPFTRLLWESYGRPPWRRFPCGHWTASFYSQQAVAETCAFVRTGR
ncbi:MAG: hypothetical protein KatS3mg131_1662 [Candidatus Tectimicrobiota bacterium]|nr:MAG: hypothetical protein KatS3mg131_1662 [Candidatus Tectomicrobia bacterium]